MANKLKYRQLSAILLLTIFGVAFMSRSAHNLFLHNCHGHERLHCDPEKEGKGPHFHDERYAANDCELCAFVFQQCAFTALTVLSLQQEALSSFRSMPMCQTDVLRNAALDAVCNRGPPLF